jgi:hypothetical protein
VGKPRVYYLPAICTLFPLVARAEFVLCVLWFFVLHWISFRGVWTFDSVSSFSTLSRSANLNGARRYTSIDQTEMAWHGFPATLANGLEVENRVIGSDLRTFLSSLLI